MVHVHHLGGCAPAPLAHYLKALGVLRLVAEQADPDARGWWDGDQFKLAGSRTYEELCEFFRRRYVPTPMLAPWGGKSGFFRTWDKTKKQFRKGKSFEALDSIRRNTDPRWGAFRSAWNEATNLLKDSTTETDVAVLTDKERSNLLMVPSHAGTVASVADKNEDKWRIQAGMQRVLSEVPFYRSVIIDVGERKPAYPGLWGGSGGNDGAMDFTARYMENLLLVLDPDNDASTELLDSSLSGNNAMRLLRGPAGKVGQFLPGGAGGANAVQGFGTQADTLLNPWDFVLMMEGAVCFTSHVSRQSRSDSSVAASPFSVNASGAAYASASTDDESARGEQWMPLWSRPSTYAELRHMLAEGRAQLGAKSAREPLDLARAVKRLGTARGIGAFQRYGYIERNGQSNLAVPLGRFTVSDQPDGNLACIDDLDTWLRRLRREARDRNAPSRLAAAERRLTDALFAVSVRSEDTGRWQGVLVRLTEVEKTMAQGSGFSAQPIPPLRPGWINASYDGSAEFRLAVSFALQAKAFGREHRVPIDPIRRHWLPLDRKAPRHFATTGIGVARRLDRQPDLVAQGHRGLDAAIALVERRVVEAAQRHDRHLPLQAAPRAATGIQDLASLLAGSVDLDRTIALAQALMATDGNAWIEHQVSVEARHTQTWPDDAWIAVRLCALPWPLTTRRGFDLDIGTDPAMIRRLAAGDAAGAFDLASRRLRAAGVHCTVRAAVARPAAGRLWAAALAFPVTRAKARLLLHRLDPSKE